MADIQTHKKTFLEEKLTPIQIAERIEGNAPTGVPADKWTEEILVCPACEQKSLDKFIGGVNVEAGVTTHTEFIYHCRVCDLNITEEQYQAAI